MKKLTCSLVLSVIALSSYGWGNIAHQYRIMFTDGRSCEPIITKSLSSNWERLDCATKDEKTIRVYFSDYHLWLFNKRMIEKCKVVDMVVDAWDKSSGSSDGYITFKNVDEFIEIED